MASFEKVGKRWKAIIRKKGYPKKTKTFDTKREANVWAVDYESRMINGIDESELKNITYTSVILRYISEVSTTKKSSKSEILRLKSFIKNYPHIANKPVTELTPFNIAEWRDDRLRSVSDATVNREWNNLSSVFNYAVKGWGLPLQENPFRGVHRPKRGKPREQRITDQDIETILTTLDYPTITPVNSVKHKVAWCFLFAIETAMRAGEILKLEPADINGRIALLRDTKNGEDRKVPLSKKALVLLENLPDGLPVGISSATLDAMYRKYRPEELSHINFHDTRHEALSRMAKKIQNPMDLAKISGHKDLKILLNTYYNPDDDHLASLLD